MSYELRVDKNRNIVSYEVKEGQKTEIAVGLLAQALTKLNERTTYYELDADPAYKELSSEEQTAVRAYFSSVKSVVKASMSMNNHDLSPSMELLNQDLSYIAAAKKRAQQDRS